MLSPFLLAACSGAGTRSPDSVPALGFLYIAFDNGTTETATVFLESFPTERVALGADTLPRRLGRVRPSRTQTFRVQAPPTEFAITASFDALGEHSTDRMRAQAGDTVMVATTEAGSLTTRVKAYTPSGTAGIDPGVEEVVDRRVTARAVDRDSGDHPRTTETVR